MVLRRIRWFGFGVSPPLLPKTTANFAGGHLLVRLFWCSPKLCCEAGIVRKLEVGEEFPARC